MRLLSSLIILLLFVRLLAAMQGASCTTSKVFIANTEQSDAQHKRPKLLPQQVRSLKSLAAFAYVKKLSLAGNKRQDAPNMLLDVILEDINSPAIGESLHHIEVHHQRLALLDFMIRHALTLVP